MTDVAHFVGPHIAVWNTFFALVQVAIGAGLLFRRTVRTSLVISFFWVLGVWFFGEGLGLILSGSASALTGAPGSVLIYGLLGLMAWPRGVHATPDPSGESAPPVGLASSAAGQGIGGATTPLVVWSGFWALAAVLFLLPDNRTTTSVSSAIIGMSPGEPSGYSHFLTHFGNHFGSVGVQGTWLLATASLVIGLGPLVARRPNVFLLAGGVLSVLFWFSGQGFGGIFTGSGTDPNTGPLVVLLALCMVPARATEDSGWRSPLTSFLRWNPVLALSSAVALALALFLSAAYPVSAQESTTTAMSGMSGMSGTSGRAMVLTGSGNQTASTASCTKGNNGALRTGLDVTNTPNMVMGAGGIGMNLNGADATAAAGLNSTKSNWTYTGPALPAALARELLAQGDNGLVDIHMASAGCAHEPTFSQDINSVQYVQSTSAAVARYSNPFLAVAAGYVAVSPTTYPVVYYVNPSIVAANAAARRTLSPAQVDGLVYAKTPSGTEVLAAAMYLLPSSVRTAPMPYGALVQWHQRTDVCSPLIKSASAGASPLLIAGVTPCTSGTVQQATPYMTMVWQVPVAGGPLAIQPPDIQIVEAAIMATTS
jgi:hypothetical protein